ncbi:MAG: transcriptional regulator [Candidatus Aenigmatarchaeota archaeon]
MRCEIIVKEILPAVRALIAKRLLSKGFTQIEIANMLDITQPAISFYKSRSRGKNIICSEIVDFANNIADRIARDRNFKLEISELCELCKKLEQSGKLKI